MLSFLSSTSHADRHLSVPLCIYRVDLINECPYVIASSADEIAIETRKQAEVICQGSLNSKDAKVVFVTGGTIIGRSSGFSDLDTRINPLWFVGLA